MSDVNMEQMPDLGRFVDWVWNLKAERDQLRAELEAIRGQQPVAQVSEETFSSNGTSDIITANLPIGTKLYALPPQQLDAVSVPMELLKRIDARMAECSPMQEHWDTLQELRALLATKTDGVV